MVGALSIQNMCHPIYDMAHFGYVLFVNFCVADLSALFDWARLFGTVWPAYSSLFNWVGELVGV